MGLEQEHELRASQALSRALREVPFYARRAASAVAPPVAGAPLTEVLRALPLLFKRDLRATLPRQWVPAGRDAKAELASGELDLVETAGTSGERARILRQRGFWARQEVRAWRTNDVATRSLAGERGPWRETVLGTPLTGMRTCHAGDLTYEGRVDGVRLFLNQRPDPTFWRDDDVRRMLDELEKHGTIGLTADPAYLARLARAASRLGRTVPVRGFVALSHGLLTAPHERAFAKAVPGAHLSVYSAAEVGSLYVGGTGSLHHVPLTTHVELLSAKVATPGAQDVALVVVTALDPGAQPLVRYVLGDLVQVDRTVAPPHSGVASISSVEGRLEDALLLEGGALVTAGALDRALAPVASIVDYQANQRERGKVDLDVVVDGDVERALVEVRTRVSELTGGALLVEPRSVAAIAPEASGRFRSARRSVPLDLGATFAGCEGAPA